MFQKLYFINFRYIIQLLLQYKYLYINTYICMHVYVNREKDLCSSCKYIDCNKNYKIYKLNKLSACMHTMHFINL